MIQAAMDHFEPGYRNIAFTLGADSWPNSSPSE